MARYQIEHGRRTRGSPATRIGLLVLLVLLLIGARSLASYAIEIRWWKEVGQFNTWLSMLTYSLAPVGAATLLDRKSTRLNSSHLKLSRMPSSA